MGSALGRGTVASLGGSGTLGYISITAAAAMLGTTEGKVHRMIASGAVTGHRLGGVWVLSATDVARLQSRPSPRHRTLSPRFSWAILATLSGRRPHWLPTRSQAAVVDYLSACPSGDIDCWRSSLRGRNDAYYNAAPPDVVIQVLEDREVVPVGPSHPYARGHGRHGQRSSPAVVYARASTWARLQRAHPTPASLIQEATLIVQVPRAIWPFENRIIDDATIAADLLESPYFQTAQAAADQLDTLVRRLRRDRRVAADPPARPAPPRVDRPQI